MQINNKGLNIIYNKVKVRLILTLNKTRKLYN